MKNFLKCLPLISLFAVWTLAQTTNQCENSEVKAFDFQIGIWETADGKETHEIKKTLGDCAVQEIWKTNGKEYAIAVKSFDLGKHNAKGEQKWVYSWIAAGFHQLWEGRRENGQWRFYREWFWEGQTVLSRTYWNQLPDGGIDRIVEQSRDGGKTWKPYVKVKFVRKKV